MKELSVLDVMALRPCYSEDKVNELFDGRDKLSLFDILDLDIPVEDRIWVLIQPGVLPLATLQKFAALTADRAVRQHCLTCGLSEVEAWAVKWLDGSDRSAKAACGARGAACGAAEAAAYWAAQAAYWAAEATAWAAYAARAAWMTADAACEAAKATGEAERQQQIADLRRLVEESA